MKRNMLGLAAAGAVLALLLAGCQKAEESSTVKVGLLHSQTGAMAQSEIPVVVENQQARTLDTDVRCRPGGC